MRNLDDPNTGQPKAFRIGFNLFMMIVYILVGILFITEFFDIGNKDIGCIVGAVLIIYGIWRGVRLLINKK